MLRIALIGHKGQLGSDLSTLLAKSPTRYELHGFDLPDFDVRNHAAVRERLLAVAPGLVINTSAFHRVDDCEDDAASAFGVNVVAVHNLAKVCRELDAPLMHFSTDYVFGADRARARPYAEDDAPGPVSVYGASRLAGEQVLRSTWKKHFLVRTCGLYGKNASQMKGGNFVEIMLKLAAAGRPLRVVDDQRLGPTATADLAPKLVELFETHAFGLYHVTNGSDCTWYELAREIFRLVKLSPDLGPTTTEAYGAKADRPRYSVLENRALARLGLAPMRPWREALRDYLAATGRLA